MSQAPCQPPAAIDICIPVTHFPLPRPRRTATRCRSASATRCRRTAASSRLWEMTRSPSTGQGRVLCVRPLAGPLARLPVFTGLVVYEISSAVDNAAALIDPRACNHICATQVQGRQPGHLPGVPCCVPTREPAAHTAEELQVCAVQCRCFCSGHEA